VDPSGVILEDQDVRKVVLPVAGNTVDVQSLQGLAFSKRLKRHKLKIQKVVTALAEHYPLDAVPIVEVLRVLMEENCDMYKDVMYWIGLGVEKQMEREVWVLAFDEPLAADAAAEHLRYPKGTHLCTSEMAAVNVSKLEVARDRVSKSNFLSLATDAARSGYKSRQNTAAVLPDNFSCWAPPAVPTVGRSISWKGEPPTTMF